MKKDAKDQITLIAGQKPEAVKTVFQEVCPLNSETTTTANGIPPDLEGSENIDHSTLKTPIKGKTDGHGNPFNVEYHGVNPDGTPRINKSGPFKEYIAITKPSKLPKDEPQTPESVVREPLVDQENPEIKGPGLKQGLSSDVAGRLFAKIQFSLFKAIGGDDWDPKPKESEELEKAYEDYFQETGKCQDLSPGWIIAAVTADYASLRITLPGTQTRIQKLTGKFKQAWTWVKWRFFKFGAYPDSRDNRERKDDTGKTVLHTSPEVGK